MGLRVPRPQVPRQENKVNNNIRVEMEKCLPPHRLDVSDGNKRPTRNLYQMNQTMKRPVEMTQKNLKGNRRNGQNENAMKQSQNAHPNQNQSKNPGMRILPGRIERSIAHAV
jgi:hypothetical protein